MQKSLKEIHCLQNKWRIKVYQAKSIKVAFTNRRKTYLSVTFNEQPQAEEAIHLDFPAKIIQADWTTIKTDRRKQAACVQSFFRTRLDILVSVMRLIRISKYYRFSTQRFWTRSSKHHGIFQTKLGIIVTWGYNMLKDNLKKCIGYTQRLQLHPKMLTEKPMQTPCSVRWLKQKLPADLVVNSVIVKWNENFGVKNNL